MRRTLMIAALLAPAEALTPGAAVSRRAVGQAAACGAHALLLAPLAAFAQELKQASDAIVYARAAEGTLTPARVIERAQEGTLVVGDGASRAELERIIAVDREALQLERATLAGLSGREYEEEKKVVARLEATLQAQLSRLADVWWGRPLFRSGVNNELRR